MFQIDEQPYGFRITLSDLVHKQDMAAWVEASQAALAQAPEAFGVLVDLRGLKLLSNESRALMEDGQKRYQAAGMVRSAVIMDSMLLTLQFKSIAKETGIYAYERYLSAIQQPDWEQLALAWITKGVDPDKRRAQQD